MVFPEIRECHLTPSETAACGGGPDSDNNSNSCSPRDSEGDNGFTSALTPVRVSSSGSTCLYEYVGNLCVYTGLGVGGMGMLVYIHGHSFCVDMGMFVCIEAYVCMCMQVCACVCVARAHIL